MTDYVFKSSIGTCIKDFIGQKRALGYPYLSSGRLLYHFDLLVSEEFPSDSTLTKEMCTAWLQSNPGEHPNGLQRRVTPVRQLGKYMKGMGYDAYIIPNYIAKKHIKYEAHIYTATELKAFFNAIDHCSPSPFSPTRRYVIPVFFRMLYCCGLRLSEARLVKREDVDLDTGKVIIRESKGWKSRIVYMSDDLRDVCREYDSIIDTMLPGRQPFFPSKNGNYFNIATPGRWFHEFWDKLPEANVIIGNPARIHDFRHGYAVHRLNKWVREGQDINVLLGADDGGDDRDGADHRDNQHAGQRAGEGADGIGDDIAQTGALDDTDQHRDKRHEGQNVLDDHVDRVAAGLEELADHTAAYLSEYMGHSNYADTDYYLSLVEEFYPEMEQRLSSVNDNILPEVYHEEE